MKTHSEGELNVVFAKFTDRLHELLIVESKYQGEHWIGNDENSIMISKKKKCAKFTKYRIYIFIHYLSKIYIYIYYGRESFLSNYISVLLFLVVSLWQRIGFKQFV